MSKPAVSDRTCQDCSAPLKVKRRDRASVRCPACARQQLSRSAAGQIGERAWLAKRYATSWWVGLDRAAFRKVLEERYGGTHTVAG